MRPRKEHYRRKLPHFQQPGQWYSVTCTLFGAIPKGAMDKYSLQLEIARNRLHHLDAEFSGIGVWGAGVSNSDNLKSDFPKSDKISGVGIPESLTQAKKDYQIALRKYRLAFDKILNNSNLPTLSLLKENNRKVIEKALLFWEGKRLTNHAWCIMSNHIHWVLTVSEKDENGKPVYLEDILHSIKLFTARNINENEGQTGQLWEHESFETTIRNERHFSNVINYVLNNPVSAGLVSDWRDWPGTRTFLSP
ncbi:MAG TPA: hypothetical protein DCR40_00320 [Prolixibacteraceae bacterium]|nr:hypothetical protein [Prolixibacteraceae bacterium]